ncbi:alpha/beta fold hydrolase [Pseudoduganella violacea]|uniref:Pimeloyl-ACP methyl ester carboxylesterase n=1 Tax=Pseudoduganella violacea TaxID=1715466 RepID=A0A7W5BFZ4_9BURK|nr:alpha/beta hydrolase [Pseudoduganella violacea]MBB3122186.1 pimeloyl-ACP methyl ester carboxylesterase [Pseudoduganella violacea]
MASCTQSIVMTNGIRLHIVEEGRGPIVLLLHGFPETSYAWRNQLPVLAAAGFRAIAPDLRGYGKSDSPSDSGTYTTLDIVADLVGLLDVLGEPQAVVVGNDWGATIAWQAVQVRPDRFRAVVALGVPLMAKAPMLPSRLFPNNEEAWFYTHYFCASSAKDELEADVKSTLKRIYFNASGDIGERNENSPNPFSMVSKHRQYLAGLPEPIQMPAWMTEQDFDIFVRTFERTGFQGALNYYLNLDRNWQLQGAFDGVTVPTPALYMVGERDTGLAIPGMKDIISRIPQLAPNLRGSYTIPDAGHWLQQEAAETVNASLIEFLRTLG